MNRKQAVALSLSETLPADIRTASAEPPPYRKLWGRSNKNAIRTVSTASTLSRHLCEPSAPDADLHRESVNASRRFPPQVYPHIMQILPMSCHHATQRTTSRASARRATHTYRASYQTAGRAPRTTLTHIGHHGSHGSHTHI